MKILLVEDDKRIAGFISKGLKQEGFSVAHMADGIDGLLLASTEKFDAAIIDIMLPGIDGLALIDKLREKKITIPILVLSAKKTVDDKVKGLKAGGDDYMTKPFAFSELVARVNALIRRASRIPEPTQLTLGDLSVDIDKREIKCNENIIELQPLEFDLLKYLLRNAGRVLSKTMIMEHVWGYNFDPQTNVVEARICNLRDKIKKISNIEFIHTIRGIGYVAKIKE